jgi:hypothetical protein
LNGNLSIAAVVITVCLWEIRSGSNTAPAGWYLSQLQSSKTQACITNITHLFYQWAWCRHQVTQFSPGCNIFVWSILFLTAFISRAGIQPLSVLQLPATTDELHTATIWSVHRITTSIEQSLANHRFQTSLVFICIQFYQQWHLVLCIHGF